MTIFITKQLNNSQTLYIWKAETCDILKCLLVYMYIGFKMSVGIYFYGLYVKIYKIKSGLGQRGGDICFPLKTPSSFRTFIEQKGTSRQRSGKGAIRKRFPLQKLRWEKN